MIDNPDYGKVIGQVKVFGILEGTTEIESFQDVIDTRRRIIVPREPDPPTAAELAATHDATVRLAIRAKYSLDAWIILVDEAIEALGNGHRLPDGYTTYRAEVARIKKETP